MAEAILVGPLAVVACLLAIAGLTKLRHPESAAAALAAARLPGRTSLVRLLGAVELAAGVLALAEPRPPATVAVGVLYFGFGAFLLNLLWAGVETGCGCLREPETPPSAVHVAFNLLAAGIASLAIVLEPPPLVEFVPELPLYGVPAVVGVATAVYLSYLVIAYLPRTLAAYRRAPASSRG